MTEGNAPIKKPSLIGEYLKEVQRLDAEARQKKRFRNVEGFPFWPHEVIRDVIFMCFFVAILFGLSAFIPYYLESPADPSGQPQVILPDWYLLWSYGLLKIAVDVTIFGQTLLTAKVLGVLLNAVVIAPLILVPFLSKVHSRRPMAAPFWAGVGVVGFVLSITLSAASVDTLIVEEWTWLAKEYVGYKLIYWLSFLLPVASFFPAYALFKWRGRVSKGQTGYENKLSDNYFRIR
jgi:quinol-cytochrome oxidoreductase complex cytochrome b subunit